MKICLAYPPLESDKGVALLSQNRQFQYFKDPTYIFPVVPATAATMLKNAGHDVLWLDGIAQQLSAEEFKNRLFDFQPDLVAMETKTPVVKQHWAIIDDLKEVLNGRWEMATVLFGDHVTALPQESLDNSKVDFVLTGGDYDFLLLNLCEALNLKPFNVDWKKLEPGIWWRSNGEIFNSGAFSLDRSLSDLPMIDRDLTDWKSYAFKNGNFKRTPGAYVMAGRDCWWGQCTFCSWPTLYPKFRVRPVQKVLDEIQVLADRYGVREIMDDTGTFPVGDWLNEFCQGMISRGLNKRVALDCNMRFGALSDKEYKLMKKAGFRLVLFGLESFNDETLRRIRKNVTAEQIVASCREARAAGLYPHITLMVGYPWENLKDAESTLSLGKWLLRKNYAYTVQATIVIPYPGSKLFEECAQHDWLLTRDWEEYDMKRPVMRSAIPQEKLMGMVREIYKTAFHPEFILRRLLSIRDLGDLAYFARAGRKIFGHVFDFQKKRLNDRPEDACF